LLLGTYRECQSASKYSNNLKLILTYTSQLINTIFDYHWVGNWDMRRSKMEVNVDVLKTLAENGKMKSTHITYGTGLNNKCLNECLEFLQVNELIQVEGQKRKLYGITNRGLETLGIAKKIDTSLQVFNGLFY
jgi:predicted transcriptional regulator